MKKRIFLLLLVAAASIHVSAATRFVTAADEHVSFTGRVLHNSNGSVYDLGGRRVSSDKLSNGQFNKGIYIYDRQKVVKK